MTTPDRQADGDYSRGFLDFRGSETAAANGSAAATSRRSSASRSGPNGGHRSRLRPTERGLAALASTGLLVAVAGAIALIVADFSTLYKVTAIGAPSTSVSGHDRHDFALAVVGLSALAMARLAIRGGWAPVLALVALGAVAVVIGPIADAHVVTSTGLIGQLHDASSRAQSGYHLELLGSILLLAGGAGRLLLQGPPWRDDRRGHRRRPRPPAPRSEQPDQPLAGANI